MRKTWVVVADRSRARIFTVATPKGPLTELEDLVHPEARAHEARPDQRPSRPIHVSNVMGNEHGARDQQAHEFAREIAMRLESGRVEHRSSRQLIVVAAPDLLGMLRKTMNGNVAKTVVQEIDKNVTQRSPADIRKLLPKFLCRRRSRSHTTPIIIEAALNGGTPRRVAPHVPKTVDEIAADGIACLDAGASIIHHHNNEPVLGGDGNHAPAPYAEVWQRIRARHPKRSSIRRWAAAGTTSRSRRRYAHIESLAETGLLDLGLVDPGTTNIGRFHADGTPRAESLVYQNTVRGRGVHDRDLPAPRPRHEHLDLRARFRSGHLRIPDGRLVAAGGVREILFRRRESRLRIAADAEPRSTRIWKCWNDWSLPWLVSIQGGDLIANRSFAPLRDRSRRPPSGRPRTESGHAHKSNVDLVAEAAVDWPRNRQASGQLR